MSVRMRCTILGLFGNPQKNIIASTHLYPKGRKSCSLRQ
ncbi:RND transporter [Burkholderia mallei]|uniref:Uncharacterized protein n=3 Tax=pseudomallei group TaxID=111527 RepID=A0A0H3HQR1_BURP2|nr:hypothetical protein BP1026B_I1940 [Burkholderia pseudomallei 1026b]ARK68709.1 RND transporter [Burkholderia pseudomallei]EEH30994.1 RND efflux system, outer membrane lipoprotein, NodT family protein [Burkholderia pseudomallei Pakistan 9]EIF64663.1 hypothetical protein BP1258A_1618 [Burkholderia pseudomallei 1258a]EIF65728.1 hypothetical protein BP1026A_1074 [Burkholderia pseudomallei 1026a]EIF67080.1 hypothetical protein BP1258B_1711 [Burkholderia pseudomallei 1258b]EIF76636.1 hypothetica